MSSPKFTVAICGGGIGGLTTAISISRLSAGHKDIHVDLYEAASKFTEIGAGVGMLRRPWGVMKALGLEHELRKLVDVPDEDKPRLMFEMRKSDRRKGVPYYDMVAPMGNLTFRRTDFQLSLVQQLDPETTTSHFSKRLLSYSLPPASVDSSSPEPITLRFKDGSSATCDILIGADGIHSATRHTLLDFAARDAEARGGADGTKEAEVLRGMVDPVWTGSVAYRSVVPREKIESLNPRHRALTISQNYTGKNKHLIVLPISRGRLINVVAFCSWPDKEGTIYDGKMVEERTQAELLAQYEGWENEVQQILQCIDKPSLWAINALKGLPISVHDRVALLGDAAHAMTPHQGSGAGQAIEDAYILGALLAHPRTTLETLPTALKVYEAVRLPHGNDVQRRSRENGRLYEFVDPRFSRLDVNSESLTEVNVEVEDRALSEVDMRKLREAGKLSVDNCEWAWTTDIETDREKAIKMFKERLGDVAKA